MPRVILTCLLFFTWLPAYAQGAYSNTMAAALNADTACPGGTVERTVAVADSFVLGDVDLGFLASHTWRGDIRLDLVSPAGTTVRLLEEDTQGTFVDNYNIRLDDEAATRVNTAPHDTSDDANAPRWQNRVRPDNPLSAFDGETSAGTWTLRMCDAFPTSDNGTFFLASLLLTPVAPAPLPPLACAGGAAPERLEWTAPGGPVGWPAGVTGARGYTVGTNTVDVDITPGPFRAQNGQATPVTSTGVSGGTGRYTLATRMDLAPGDAPITYTLGFNAGGRGIGGVDFTVHDVDRTETGFQDSFTVTASRLGNPVPVTILPTVTANYADGNRLVGLAPVASASAGADARVVVDAPLDTLTIVYGTGPSSPADPSEQVTGFSLVTFCPAPVADISATKTVEVAGGGFAVPGSDVVYTLEVTNAAGSTSPAQSLALVDTLPASLLFGTATASGFTGGTFDPALPAPGTDCAAATCTVSFKDATLAAGGTARVEIEATVK